MGTIHRCRVFVAEDDDELRTLLAQAFRRDGHDVIEVADGPALVECLVSVQRNGSPLDRHDVVVSDIHMPGFSGLQVLASFHNLALDTPFIVISAFADATTQEDARQMGAAAFFSKPFDIDALRVTVSHLIGLR